jgi:arylsulfatase A-like enzyme
LAQGLVNTGWDQQVKESGQVERAIQGYLASVSFSDAQMGRVLDALDRSPYRDNTIVVLLSDHGFHLGEKRQWSKCTLWEEATASVLMFRVPGLTKPNQVCNRPVSLLDIYPTLVDLVGLPKPDHLDGQTLVSLLRDSHAPRAEPAIMAYAGHIAVRTENYRFIRYTDGTTELYDRGKDPNEWNNQTDNPQYADIKANLAAYLPAPEDMATPVRNPKKDRSSEDRKKRGTKKTVKG